MDQVERKYRIGNSSNLHRNTFSKDNIKINKLDITDNKLDKSRSYYVDGKISINSGKNLLQKRRRMKT